VESAVVTVDASSSSEEHFPLRALPVHAGSCGKKAAQPGISEAIDNRWRNARAGTATLDRHDRAATAMFG